MEREPILPSPEIELNESETSAEKKEASKKKKKKVANGIGNLFNRLRRREEGEPTEKSWFEEVADDEKSFWKKLGSIFSKEDEPEDSSVEEDPIIDVETEPEPEKTIGERLGGWKERIKDLFSDDEIETPPAESLEEPGTIETESSEADEDLEQEPELEADSIEAVDDEEDDPTTVSSPPSVTTAHGAGGGGVPPVTPVAGGGARGGGGGGGFINPLMHNAAHAANVAANPLANPATNPNQTPNFEKRDRSEFVKGLIVGGVATWLYQRRKRNKLENRMKKEITEKKRDIEELKLKNTAHELEAKKLKAKNEEEQKKRRKQERESELKLREAKKTEEVVAPVVEAPKPAPKVERRQEIKTAEKIVAVGVAASASEVIAKPLIEKDEKEKPSKKAAPHANEVHGAAVNRINSVELEKEQEVKKKKQVTNQIRSETNTANFEKAPDESIETLRAKQEVGDQEFSPEDEERIISHMETGPEKLYNWDQQDEDNMPKSGGIDDMAKKSEERTASDIVDEILDENKAKKRRLINEFVSPTTKSAIAIVASIAIALIGALALITFLS